MRKLCLCLFATVALATRGFAQDLEPIEADQARGFATKLAELAGAIEKPQVKIEADADKAVGLHSPHRCGLLIVPRKDLVDDPENKDVKTENGAALAFLFLYKIVPVVEGKQIEADKLRQVEIVDGQGAAHSVHFLLLSVKKVADDDWRLLAYGKDKKPVVNVKFSEGKGNGTTPIGVAVEEVSGNEGTVVLTLFDKYQAKVRGTYIE